MTQRALAFTADLDISDVSRGLRRIEMQSRRAGASVGRVGAGVGRAVSAGAGIGAGAAIFEMLFQKVFEIFEGTPILVTFTEAIDQLLKAFGPVIGVLLTALLPVIEALTPAIEPLARAITPLIELLGTGLLVAVQLMVPGITLLATGLEVATTFLRDFVTSGIEFLVSQLNKLPFVDIQLEIDKTGNSFDSMAAQIDAAGDESETAEGKVKGLAGAVKEVEAVSITAASSQRLVSETQAVATARVDAYRMGLERQRKVAEIAQMTADELTDSLTAMGLAAGEGRMEADLLALSLGGVRMGFSNTTPEATALESKIIELTSKIMDATRETELEEMALAALSPELIESARLLGLFGLAVSDVGQAADDLARGGIGGDRGPNGAIYTQTNPDGSRQSGRPAPGPRYLDEIAQDPITNVFTNPQGVPTSFQTAAGGSEQFWIHVFGRLDDALAFLGRNTMPTTEAVEMAAAATETATEATEMMTAATMEAGTATMTAVAATEMMTAATMEAAPMIEKVTSAIVGPGSLNQGLSSFTTGIFAASDAISGLSLEFETATVALTGGGLNQGLSSFTTGIFAASDAIAGQVRIIGELTPEVSDLDALLAQMTMTILDTAAAADLQEMALAALSPELRALAEELGLFGLSVRETATNVTGAIDEIDNRNSRVYGPGGSLAGGQARAQQRLQDYLDEQERQRFFSDLTSGTQPVMVIIDGESVATATTRAESEGVM